MDESKDLTMNRKQCPDCGDEMDEQLPESFAFGMPGGGWHCPNCGSIFRKSATGEVSRREMILAAAGISLVGVPQSDSFEHRKMNNCLAVLWFPPGTTNTTEGVIDNRDVARDCLDCMAPDSKLILPTTTDEYGNRLWELRVFQLGGSDGKSGV